MSKEPDCPLLSISKKMTGERIVKFFGKQFDAFNFSTQFGAAVSGVQSGKTFLGAHWAGKKTLEFPDKCGIIAAPTYKILQSATLKKFFEVFPELRQYHKEQKGEIQLPTGGYIYLRSADNPLGFEGITAHWAWLDEGGMTSELTWTVLRSRVSMTGGQILITTTPYNMGWLYQQFFLPWKKGIDKNLSFFTWRSIDNPAFSKEFYEAERSRLPPEEFSRRYMGEFKKMTGLVWDVTEDRIISPIDGLSKKAESRIAAVDWGFRNPTAIIIAYKYDKAWYLVDEWKMAEKTTGEIIQVLKNLIHEHQVYKVYADPAEPDRIEEAKRAGVPIYEANKDVVGGLGFIRQLLYEKRFFVYQNCKGFLDEAAMYHYEPIDGKEQKEIPVKFNDHIVDAVRYGIFTHDLQPVLTFASASQPLQPYYPELGL